MTIDTPVLAEPLRNIYRLKEVSKTYGGKGVAVNAVDNVSLRISPGEFVVIVGPSGSGKSTLLQLLGALDRPTAGIVEFDGCDIAEMDDGELADIRLNTVGFIFQQFNLVPTLTAAENIELAMAPTGASNDEIQSRIRDLLEQVGLAERHDHLPGQLSGGEQQRVAIARALANGPEVLLADEPTGNLDSKTGDSILEMLFELWRESSLTVVLITHDKSIAERAPRVIGMRDGRVSSERVDQPRTTLVDGGEKVAR